MFSKSALKYPLLLDTFLKASRPILSQVIQLYYAVQALITKCHKLCGLRKQEFIYQSSGGWKTEIKLSAGLGSGKDDLSGFQMVIFFMCPHKAWGKQTFWRVFLFIRY